MFSQTQSNKLFNQFNNFHIFGLNECLSSIKLQHIIQEFPKIEIKKMFCLFYAMYFIRKFEEKCSTAYGQKAIGGFCHLYIGQEATATSIQSLLNPEDDVITAYRCHGHMLLSGANPAEVFGELMGKEIGSSKGKGGSMHLFNPKKRFWGGHGIVGAQVPLGTGLAFAHKYKQDNGISIVCMGDGASNQGQVYESFNMAALWGLPALFVIENNGYGMGTSCERACAGDLFKRGEAYGIRGTSINGMNALEAIKALAPIISDIRRSSSPQLVEMKTYRYKGHSMSDPALYRSKNEVETMKKIDPIVILEDTILHENANFSEYLDQMKEFIENTVSDAYKKAESSSSISSDTVFYDVYA